MSPMHPAGGDESVGSRLLMAVAQELKLPLLHIAHQTELYEHQHGVNLPDIHTSAQHALLLIDTYVLARELTQESLALEPVTVSSVLYDVAQTLQPLAKQYDCSVRVSLGGRYRPVMSHRSALYGMLAGLSTALLTVSQQPKGVITLAAHKHKDGIQTGVFGEGQGLGDRMFEQGKTLLGRARSPLTTFTAQPGAGVFIAHELGQAMGVHVRVAQHNNLKGFAALLSPSQQLVLL